MAQSIISNLSALAAYPVGSIYMSVNQTSPATLFGGTWQRIQDTFLLAAGTTYTAGDTGGEATHILTPSETALKSHTHSYSKAASPTGSAGGHSHTMPIGWDTNSLYTASQTEGATVATGPANVIAVKSTSSSTGRRYGASTSSVSNHSHTVSTTSDTTGNVTTENGSAHNNMPPYLAVYMWQRTA